MVEQELKLSQPKVSPANVAVVVGISAMIGSVIPIAPFLLFSVHTAIIATLVFSTAVLFCVGIYKGYITGNNPLRSGIELAIIGMLAALAGYAIGALTGAIVLG
jgi:predicted membrane protein (TIGR00267 family)